jgi:uncharacterized protein (DUF433 family)
MRQLRTLAAPWLPALFGGLTAALTSALVQGVLWLMFTDAFPTILYRDVRLAAAIVLGPAVLDGPPGFPGTGVWVVAVAIHVALSLTYALVFCALTRTLRTAAAILAGGALGAGLFLVNMYGFTFLFPWFAAARDWITLVAHVAFGASCVAGCRGAALSSRAARAG